MAAPRRRFVPRWPPVLIVLAAVTGTVRAEEPRSSSAALFAGARSSMALIGREVDADGSPGVTWLGTGFMVDGKCTLASAKHILHGVDGDRFLVRMQSSDSRRAPILHARVIFRKPELDLVFLKLVGSTIGQSRCPDEFRDHLKLSESFDDGLVGETVLLTGFPMLEGGPPGAPILRHGHIASAELEWEGHPMLLLDLRSAPGYSGAPVILERTGEVIGVLFGSGLTPREYDLTWATPITREDHRAALRGGEKKEAMRIVGPLMPLAACALILLAGCRGDESTSIAGAPLILISIDTLRSDRLPAYGYDAVATPGLDALAADSVLFERAYSHCPLTLPSHASLFTGLLPPDHGVRDNREFELIAQRETLAELLRDSGYRTAGFVSSMVLRRSTGIAQGFEHYDDAIEEPAGRRSTRSAERSGARTIAAATSWLSGLAPDEPFLLFVHLYEPHAPYEAPEPFGSRYDDAYDAEVAHSDSLVGGLLDRLKQQELYDPALIVLLSDHGEGLSDHGEREHGLLLYREALQVPLMIKLPQSRSGGRRFDAPVGLADVAPTVLALLGLAARPGTGQALLDGDPPPGRAIYSESRFGMHQYGWSELRSVIRDRLHYIEAPTPVMYDVVADPLERSDLLAVQDAPAALLRALGEIGAGAADRAVISEEETRQLASLGYLGGGATGGGSAGADPGRLVHDVERLWSFVHGDGSPDRVLDDESLRGLLDSIGGGNEYLRRMLASALQHEQRFALALEVLQPLAESGNADTQVVLGQTLISLGRLPEARAALDRALALDEDLGEAHLGMGILLMTREAFAEAEPWLARAVALDAGLSEAWNGIGVLRMRGGDARGAMEAWATTVAIDPELDDAWFNLAIARHRLGDLPGAAEALERYIPLVEGDERQRAQAMLNGLGRGS